MDFEDSDDDGGGSGSGEGQGSGLSAGDSKIMDLGPVQKTAYFPVDGVELEELDEDGLGADDDDFDRFGIAGSQREDRSKSSIPCASFNFINSILGAGLLGMPFAFSEAGFLMAIVLLGVAAFLTDYSCRLLIRVGVGADRLSYPALVQRALGRTGYAAISFFMFLTAIGATVTYTTIVGDIGPVLMSHVAPAGSFWVTRDFFIILFCGGVMLPLSLLRNVASLGKFSALATGCLLFIFCTVLINTPGLTAGDRRPLPTLTLVSPNFFPALGIMAFAFVCQHNSFMIFGSLHNNTVRRWATTSHLSVGFAYVILCGVGIFGFLAFAGTAEGLHGNILCNLPDDVVSHLARLAAGFVLALTFPIEIFVGREVVLEGLRRWRWARTHMELGSEEGGRPSSLAVHASVTLGLWVLSTSVGWWAGSAAGIVLELTGGFSATAIAFILPAACALRLEKDRSWTSYERIMPMIMLVFGTVAMIAATSQTVYNIASGNTHDEGCFKADLRNGTAESTLPPPPMTMMAAMMNMTQSL